MTDDQARAMMTHIPRLFFSHNDAKRCQQTFSRGDAIDTAFTEIDWNVSIKMNNF